ncbi:hypothetical protein [Lactiplantibacillus daowaiensis]|uniref:Uncharacterized protein n=1 Tax=Lactiplantibacillus daowaiensis TaxID=2559918 RepID=A0ABW1S1Z8_9LACO|nr:hypothetical protein [Lactiplantibacillus daowaiensis]
MKKAMQLPVLLGLGLMLGGVGASYQVPTAQAAAWHTGTPKVLRHKWVEKGFGIHFYKKHIVVWDRSVGWLATAHPWINVRYQKIGKNKYRTFAYCPHDDRNFLSTWKLSANHKRLNDDLHR